MEQQQLPEALRQRYGDSDQPANIIWSDALALLLDHRSVRSYRAEALPDGTLETLIAAAQSASTSSNLQTWSVVAIEDQGRKDRLSQLAGDQEHVRTCPLFLVWLADLSRLARVASQEQLPHDGIDYTEMFILAVVDAALAAQNAAIAAEALGLGTVYIGGIRNQPLAVVAELQLPARIFPVFGMCIGWPDPANPAAIKPRLPQQAIVHHETYNPDAEAAAVGRYNETMATFYEQQGMRVAGNWAQHSSRRVAGPQSLTGRHTIRETLEQLGFELR